MATSTSSDGRTITSREKIDADLEFDYDTNRYVSLSQEREIKKLKVMLEEKAKERSKTIASIVAHYYKK